MEENNWRSIHEQSLVEIIDELITRSKSGCIVLNMKAYSDPCIIYHANNYKIDDLLKIIAMLDIARDWFKARAVEFERDV